MAAMFKVEINDSWFTREGLGHFCQSGEAVVVDGVAMVRIAGGSILKADGWSADKAKAYVDAARRTEELGLRLIAQAEKLRIAATKYEVAT